MNIDIFTDIFGITAIMMCPMIAIGATCYYSYLATKDIGKE
jgi:hypothetical protein